MVMELYFMRSPSLNDVCCLLGYLLKLTI